MFYLFPIYFVLFGIAFGQNEFLFPSDGQDNNCGKQENCISFKDCDKAVQEWKLTKTKPKSCYFEGNEQYVCCPVQKPLTRIRDSTSASISEDMCNEYYNAFAEKLGGGFKINVVGGVNAAPREFPFMVALRWGDYDGASSYLCGGMLIAPTFLLTAAHCTSNEGKTPKFARLGGGDLTESGARDIQIKSIIVHPKYNPETLYNDIAIIELETRTRLTPACLWNDKNTMPKNVTAIGYGHKEFAGANSKILQKVNISVFSNKKCKTYYNGKKDDIPQGIKKTQICAGELVDEKDTCQGDSGGPILTKLRVNGKLIPYVIGITSFGSFCATGIPAVYTRISEYRSWIEGIVWKE